MDRISWLRGRRQEAEERYDTGWSPLDGEKWGVYPNASHLQYIQKFIELLPPGSMVLDAARGAGT